MLRKEQEPTELGDPVAETVSKVFFVLAALFMLLAEANLINGLWFGPKHSSFSLKMVSLPIFVFTPGLLGLAMLSVIGRMLKTDEIRSPTAAKLKYHLAILLFFAYMAMLRLSEIAFP
jgi:hypothetical protein